MKLEVDASKCTGCRLCELVCSLRHEGTCNPRRSRIRVRRESLRLDLPEVCIQCEERSCTKACPHQALIEDERGAIRVKEERCTACGACVFACPYHAIQIHPSRHVAMVCDLCDGDPACVKYCVLGALRVS